ncbi:MAG: tRNA epoxyqueuosine(34) reductase QueG [Bacteroidales bacterium]
MKIGNSLIRQLSFQTGFSACGIGKTTILQTEKERLESWLKNDYHGEMNYLARDPEKRANPALIMDGAKSIIVLAYHYAPDPVYIPDAPFKIARFALGLDYHVVLKEKMSELLEKITEVTGPFQYRMFTDSAPIMEKAWAVKTGIGWIGKNTLLQIKGKGSWFLLSEIITDLDLEADPPYEEQHCGNCRRCLDACPTAALIEPFVLDARKCISYLNFEYKGPFEPGTHLHGRLYGCDICQEVCPFNKPLPFNSSSWLSPNPGLAILNKEDWVNLDEETFNERFRNSGIYRNGYQSLRRNILQNLERDQSSEESSCH